MRRFIFSILTVSALLLATAWFVPVFAQGAEQVGSGGDLMLFTEYPSQVVGIGETPTINLTLRTASTAQLVTLSLRDLPENWEASFRGGSRVVESAFVQPGKDASVDLRLEPAADVTPGVYDFVVIAQDEQATAELPIELTVQEKVPASLTFGVELPTLRGKLNSDFRYTVTLKNDGGEDLTVDLLPSAPSFFDVAITSSGQEVTSLPIEANSSKTLTVQAASPLSQIIPAGDYPISLTAQGGDAQANVDLTAEVVGESSLTLTTPDGRLSGRAEAGSQTPVTLVVRNTGSGTAHTIKLSASAPDGWTVDFDPQQIDQIEANQQVEVTAHMQPADKALAGDYVVTFRAQPDQGASESADYRVTVRTPTLWGVAGIGLIAVAVAAVGLAVIRFGRR